MPLSLWNKEGRADGAPLCFLPDATTPRRSTSGAGGPQQIAAQRRMADRLVADHVDERRFARTERALQRRYDLVGLFDVLAMASEFREDLVVADVLEHVKRVAAAL